MNYQGATKKTWWACHQGVHPLQLPYAQGWQTWVTTPLKYREGRLLRSQRLIVVNQCKTFVEFSLVNDSFFYKINNYLNIIKEQYYGVFIFIIFHYWKYFYVVIWYTVCAPQLFLSSLIMVCQVTFNFRFLVWFIMIHIYMFVCEYYTFRTILIYKMIEYISNKPMNFPLNNKIKNFKTSYLILVSSKVIHAKSKQ